MELSQLKYFLTVANCGQISQAANLLYVSQSAISMSIRLITEPVLVQLSIHHPLSGRDSLP